jgi:hypothetical protein
LHTDHVHQNPMDRTIVSVRVDDAVCDHGHLGKA